MALTDEQVQETLSEGIALVEEWRNSVQKELILAYLKYMKEFSKSGNDIPVLQGQGLSETLAFVERLKKGERSPIRVLTKRLAQAFQNN